MYTTEQVIKFIEQQTGCDNIQPDDDLYRKHGIYGDDWFEILDKYAATFQVDMHDHIWHYHNRPEGGLPILNRIWPEPSKEKYIPITAAMLTQYANKGKWNAIYPPGALQDEHEKQEQLVRTPNYNAMKYILLVVLLLCFAFIWYWSR